MLIVVLAILAVALHYRNADPSKSWWKQTKSSRKDINTKP